MDVTFAGYELNGLGAINLILGKNGCGKSTLLRSVEENRRQAGYLKYITPERSGELRFDGGIETQMQDPNWLTTVRGRNRFESFRQLSVSEFRRLETLVLRKIEKDRETRADPDITFDTTIELINDLLDNVEVVRSENGGFQVREKGRDSLRDITKLSSGESELITLAIEILSFAYMAEQDQYKEKENWLLFDDPDVHLHPDLQYRLMRLLARVSEGKPFKVVIATHSTAILSALSDHGTVNVSFMGRHENKLRFEPVSAALKAVIPIFGAHPLSNVFNERPILLLEGDDDERIWQQAYRSSNGAIAIWPCVAGDVQSLQEYEQKTQSIIGSVYDTAKAFSLRDRDDSPYEIDDLGSVTRARLNCRSSENLLATDDVLLGLGTDWPRVQAEIERWIDQNPDHPQFMAARKFRDGGWDRRNANLKPLRNLVMAFAGSQKPWEVAVGQAIALLKTERNDGEQNSLTDFLGPKLVDALDLKPSSALAGRDDANAGARRVAA